MKGIAMTNVAMEQNVSLTSGKEQALLLWFEECGIADVPIVGGKNASLGEMIGHRRIQRHPGS